MKSEPVVYTWESFPEYHATQQYSRCLGRILASLPRRVARRTARPLIRAAILMAKCIAGAHADLKPGETMLREHREAFRQTGIGAVILSRVELLLLKEEKSASQADVLACLELLERVEDGLRSRALP